MNTVHRFVLLLLACGMYAYGGERPYELVWANRTHDDHPAQVPFTDARGWTVVCERASATLTTSTNELLFGDGTVQLTYCALDQKPIVRLEPLHPIVITQQFDAVSCWIYGNNHSYAPDPKTPPVSISLEFGDAQGKSLVLPLLHVHHQAWFLAHRRLTAEHVERLSHGATLRAILVANGTNREARTLFFNSLAFFQESFPALTFSQRPQRGVTVFPTCDPGLNTGPGRLPFPTRAGTIIPDDPVPHTVTVEKQGQTYGFIRDGADGRLEIKLPEKMGQWDDLAVRWNGAAWLRIGVDGGVYFEAGRATRETCEISQDGAAVVYRGTLNGCASSIRFELVGKSLVADLQVAGHDVREVRFGACADLNKPRAIGLPYYTYNGYGDPMGRPHVVVSDTGDAQSPYLYLMAHVDWTQSNATEPFGLNDRSDGCIYSNGGVRYVPRTDTVCNPCFERFVWSISPEVDEVLPVIPNPTSVWKHVTGRGVWRAHGAGQRDQDAAYWRSIHRRGMTQLIVTDHEVGWRDGNESFTFRTKPAPKKGGDEGQYTYARIMQDELGFVYGPYNNFTDFAPVNEYWSFDMISRSRDNQLQHAWERCYAPKPARAVEYCEKLAPVIQKKFTFSTAYCDVHTAVTPWSRVDFDPRVPGAGSFASVFYAYGEIMLLQKQAWNGPVYSEGNNHFPYCGLTDGNYAQDQAYRIAENPWIVNFDLRRLHDLCCNFGMGAPDMFYPGKSQPADFDAMLDRFLTATLAFGHPGFFVHTRPGELRSYYMIQPIAADYTQQPVQSIEYIDADGALYPARLAMGNGVYARSQLLIRYANGTSVIANGNTTDMLRVRLAGQQIELPPNGYRAQTADRRIRVFSGEVDGRRADCAVSPTVTYVDGRGAFVRFDEGACAGKAAYKRSSETMRTWGEKPANPPPRGEEIFLFDQQEAGFPLTIESAVGLAEDYSERGRAEIRVARGLSYILPMSNAVSYRVVTRASLPVSALSCPESEVVAGAVLNIRGEKGLYTYTVPADAKEGSHLWASFENGWIDFTVVPPARLKVNYDQGTATVLIHSRVEGSARLDGQPILLRKGSQTLKVARSVDPCVEQLTFSLAVPGCAPVRYALQREKIASGIALTQFSSGQCLRTGSEHRIATASGAQARAGTTACGGVEKKGIFMHPPYQGGCGYVFARYGLDLPESPRVFRFAVGKGDRSDLGDGILFKVLINGETCYQEQVATHGWKSGEIDLAPWAGKRIALTLVADCGEKNNTVGDWGAWGDLAIDAKTPRYRWTPAPIKKR